MTEVIEEPFGAEHKERVYRTMEIDVKMLKDARLKMLFDNVVDWGWEGEVFCLFCKPESFPSLFLGSDQRFQTFLRAFSQRHGIQVELRALDPVRFGTYSPYQQRPSVSGA
jgi:hypothetical protein